MIVKYKIKAFGLVNEKFYVAISHRVLFLKEKDILRK